MTNSFIKLLLKGRGARDILRCKNFVYLKKNTTHRDITLKLQKIKDKEKNLERNQSLNTLPTEKQRWELHQTSLQKPCKGESSVK